MMLLVQLDAQLAAQSATLDAPTQQGAQRLLSVLRQYTNTKYVNLGRSEIFIGHHEIRLPTKITLNYAIKFEIMSRRSVVDATGARIRYVTFGI